MQFANRSRLGITLVAGVTDMRKSIDGLCNVVQYSLEQEPASERQAITQDLGHPQPAGPGGHRQIPVLGPCTARRRCLANGRSTCREPLSRWVLGCGEAIKPLVAQLRQALLKGRVIHADETPLKVINTEQNQSYMWVYTSNPRSQAPPLVLYDHRPGRHGSHAAEFLKGFSGYHQTDATLVGCWAHARRKFTDCIKGRKPNAKPGKPHWAVNHIKKLYAIEQQIKDLTVEQRHQVR